MQSFGQSVYRSVLRLGIVFIVFVLFSAHVVSAQNLERIGQLSYAPLSLAGCWHHVDNSGGEWALVGTSAGLSIVDLDDPTQPVERFTVPGPSSNWREVKTWAGYAYFGSEAAQSGITIVNLNYLPDSIQWKVWKGDGFFADKMITSHALQAEAGYLYVCGGSTVSNGTVIADLVDPWNPHILSKYAANYVHDAFIRGDTLWTSEIYQGQFGVVDISDRSNPVLLATHPTPGAFNHNTGLSADGKTLFTTDEVANAPLGAFDVSNLDNIRLRDIYKPSRKPQGEVHNVRVVEGDFLVCPSYRGQLTIVDGSRPDNLIETAWDSLGNSLVWDADPYLPSGIIFATAKSEGLFVYKKPTYKHAAWIEGLVIDGTTGLPLPDAKVFVLNTPNADTTGADGIYQTGATNSGTYVLRAEHQGYQSQVVTNVPLMSNVIASINFTLFPLVGTKTPETDQFVQVSPSPFDDFLRVEISAESPFANGENLLQLSDLSGKVMLERTAQKGSVSILEGLEQLPSGVYLLRIQQVTGLATTLRVIKK